MALVLTRKVKEQIIVGNTIISVERIGKGRVSIGIKAPQGVKVLRAELTESREAEGTTESASATERK